MKKLVLLSVLLGAMPFTMMAQDDDLYFVPTKENVAKEAEKYGMPTDTYYAGSTRSADEYNRRAWSRVAPIDSAGNDIIDFSAERGVYPDSAFNEVQDYKYTRRMSRFDDYSPSVAYWEGYRDGRWSSPWYYSNYTWYDPFYYPWYGSLYDPWYYGFYSPYYYRYSYYGWPFAYYYGSYYYGGGGPGGYYSYNRNGGTGGSISRYGNTHGHFTGYRGASGSSSTVASGARASSARSRTVSGHTAINRSGNTSTSSSYSGGNFSGARSSSVSSSSSSGGGGSFSGGGGGAVRSSGGGGGGGGGIRSSGRR